MSHPSLCLQANQRLPWQLDRAGNAIMARPRVGLLRQKREAELFLHGPSQEAAHAVLLPAGRCLQFFYSRSFRAVEQVEAACCLVFAGAGLTWPREQNGTLAARLPFRRFPLMLL